MLFSFVEGTLYFNYFYNQKIMASNSKILLLFLLIISTYSCSNIKVLASWKADYAKDIVDNNVTD